MTTPTIPPARLPAAGPVNPPPHVSPDGAGSCVNDCGGVDGDTQLRELSAGKQRTARAESCHTSEGGRGLEAAAEVQGSRFDSGPQSPSDFGLIVGLATALPLGLLCWLGLYAVIAALLVLQ